MRPFDSPSAGRPLPNVSGAPAPLALETFRAQARPFLVAVPALGLLTGFLVRLVGQADWSGLLWAIATVPVLAALLVEIVGSLRRGEVGLDLVAALSMTGALIFGENLAGVVVALMYAGGQYLESFAEKRANREITALLSRLPRTALRYVDGRLDEVSLDNLAPGDRILVRQGDVVPVDGIVARKMAVLDQSALTGESLPVQKDTGEAVMSGVTNVGGAFDLQATHRAAESTYAGIIRLIEAARLSKAPMARLADRFALVFLAVTVILASAAWFISGDPIRALAVLVIATPCPLILAVPVAIVSGVSRAAKAGVLVKGGKALEMLASASVLVIDKTGTLTHGEASLVTIEPFDDRSPESLLMLAASLDQASGHVIAHAIVREARARGLALTPPVGIVETPGEGLMGTVGEERVAVGGLAYVSRQIDGAGPVADHRHYPVGSVIVAVAVDGRPAGVLVLADRLRPGVGALIAHLRHLGIRRMVLASGDRRDVVDAVTASLSFDASESDLTPERKIAIVQAEKQYGRVMMIGDGVNDAPALSAADLGVAMGAKGAAASAEAADVVILVDDLSRIAVAIEAARWSRHIALQSVYAGIGLSIVGMVVAMLGYLTPVQGALIQEVIDVAVILNALRALRGPPRVDTPLRGCHAEPGGAVSS